MVGRRVAFGTERVDNLPTPPAVRTVAAVEAFDMVDPAVGTERRPVIIVAGRFAVVVTLDSQSFLESGPEDSNDPSLAVAC